MLLVFGLRETHTRWPSTHTAVEHIPPTECPLPSLSLSLSPFASVMTDAFRGIWELAARDALPLRVAAFAIALQRVMQARMNRGFD